jgi:hypothetical protein
LHTVLVLGGYGSCGAHISRALADDPDVLLLIAGRNLQKAQRFALQLGLSARRGQYLDATAPTLSSELLGLGVNTLIHAAGPFRGRDYRVARACIEAGCHYIDLADERDFVADISQLDGMARAAGVLVTSGAGLVPALSAAVVDHFLPQFSRLDSIDHGFAASARMPGLAALRAMLESCGKPFKRLREGAWQTVSGWQGLRLRSYPQPVGRRWLANSDTPDLALFPLRYPGVRTVTSHAGLGSPLIQLAIWMLSWPVRRGWVANPASLATPLRWLGRGLEVLGSRNCAMHMTLSGLDPKGLPLTRTWHMLAFNRHGAGIPCGAAIALTRKLVRGDAVPAGAGACVGLLTLEEYLAALATLEIIQILS